MSRHTPTHMSMHTPMHMSMHMTIHMTIHMSIYMTVHMSIHMSMRMSIHMSTHISQLAILAGDFLLSQVSVALARLNHCETVELMSATLGDLVQGEIIQVISRLIPHPYI